MTPRAAGEGKLFFLAAAVLAAAAALLAPASAEATRYLPDALAPVAAPLASLEELAGTLADPAHPLLRRALLAQYGRTFGLIDVA